MEWPQLKSEATVDNYRYNGKEWNDEFGLGLLDYGARWYDGAIARFKTIDPLADAPNLVSWSPCHYTYNNPINYVDPTGENPVRAAIAGARLAKRAYRIYKKTGKLDAKSLKKAGVDELVDIAGDLHTIFAGEASLLDRVSAAGDLIIGTDFNKKGQQEILSLVDKAGDTLKKVPKAKRGRGSVPPNERDPKRVFSKKEKQEMLDRQDNKCPNCNKSKTLDEVQGHHVERHADGGRTTKDNGVSLCKDCHKDVHRKN